MFRSLFFCLCVLLSLVPISQAAEPAQGETRKLVEAYRSAVVFYDTGVKKGTGFLISKDPPLVVTVAHVASLAKNPSDIVVRDNITGVERKVSEIHIHKDFKLQKSGSDPYSPDLAILKLTEPIRDSRLVLPLAKRKSSRDLQGLDVATLGFPFYATLGKDANKPELAVRVGIIQRIMDFDGQSTQTEIQSRPLFEHSIASVDGESGGPIVLLSSGHVIGIQVGVRRFRERETRVILHAIPLALHVDELYELIDQAKYSKLFP